MKIKKIGHCCLYIEVGGVHILTDPGMYSVEQNDIVGIDFVLITHEHADHYHIDSVKAILKNNPQAVIITNNVVSVLLKKENISCNIVVDGETFDMKGVSLRGKGLRHAPIYKTIEPVENTGYFIDKRLFYPGDAFTLPEQPVDILALPVAGPWVKISEVIDYALTVRPKKCFPVHDAMLKNPGFGLRLLKDVLPKEGIELIPLEAGQMTDMI